MVCNPDHPLHHPPPSDLHRLHFPPENKNLASPFMEAVFNSILST